VRVIKDEKGEPWFVAKDVADILGYKETNDMTIIISPFVFIAILYV